MKTKKQQSLKNVSFQWRKKRFHDPYKVITEVFDYANLGFYRKFIGDVLLYSSLKKQYKKLHTGNMLFLLEGISCLLQACSVIGKEQKQSVLDFREKDLLNRKFYSFHTTDTECWADFPRSLSVAETNNPYAVFKNVFQCKSPEEWMDAFKDLVEDACGSYADVSDENTLDMYMQLTKVLEAAHLIYIREIVYIRNWRIPQQV